MKYNIRLTVVFYFTFIFSVFSQWQYEKEGPSVEKIFVDDINSNSVFSIKKISNGKITFTLERLDLDICPIESIDFRFDNYNGKLNFEVEKINNNSLKILFNRVDGLEELKGFTKLIKAKNFLYTKLIDECKLNIAYNYTLKGSSKAINKIELINFFIKFSFFIMLFQILLTAAIVPKSQDLARSFLRTSSINYLENFIKPKIFNDAVKGLTIYSNSKDEFGNLKEIYLKKGSGENFQITFAKEGRFKQIGKNQFLELNFGETISVINNKITNFKFRKTDFNLSNFDDNTTTYKKTQEVTTIDLVKCYHNLMNFNILKIDNRFSIVFTPTFLDWNSFTITFNYIVTKITPFGRSPRSSVCKIIHQYPQNLLL